MRRMGGQTREVDAGDGGVRIQKLGDRHGVLAMDPHPRIQGLRIYTPDDKGQVRVLASKVESEAGLPGTDAEQGALNDGKVFYGSGKGSVFITMALNDRNGMPIAAVRVQLKSYMLGETRDMVLTRVHIIVDEMQKRVLSKKDLME